MLVVASNLLGLEPSGYDWIFNRNFIRVSDMSKFYFLALKLTIKTL